MKAKGVGSLVLAMHVVVLAGFSLLQGCKTADGSRRWPLTSPKDQPVILPVDNTINAGLPSGSGSLIGLPPAVSEKVYSVKKGDTLASIAAMNGMSWKALAEHNNLSNPNLLKVGQEIRIPGSPDTIVPVRHAAPPVSRPSDGAIKQGSSYVIQRGDYLSSIAKRSGLTVSEIKAANGLKSDSIVAGKKLTIPKKGEVKAVAVAKPAAAKPSVTKAANSAPAIAPAASLPAAAPLVDAAPASSASAGTSSAIAAPAAPAAAAPISTAVSAPVYDHVLYPGETLDDVARQYGSSQQEIMKLNNITDPTSIKPGTKLLVPIPE